MEIFVRRETSDCERFLAVSADVGVSALREFHRRILMRIEVVEVPKKAAKLLRRHDIRRAMNAGVTRVSTICIHARDA
jgi:hypothetical protein